MTFDTTDAGDLRDVPARSQTLHAAIGITLDRIVNVPVPLTPNGFPTPEYWARLGALVASNFDGKIDSFSYRLTDAHFVRAKPGHPVESFAVEWRADGYVSFREVPEDFER